MVTFATASASASALASPIPWPAPVTTATRPPSLNFSRYIFSCSWLQVDHGQNHGATPCSSVRHLLPFVGIAENSAEPTVSFAHFRTISPSLSKRCRRGGSGGSHTRAPAFRL